MADVIVGQVVRMVEPVEGESGETFRLDWTSEDETVQLTYRFVLGQSGTIDRAGIIAQRIMVPLFQREAA